MVVTGPGVPGTIGTPAAIPVQLVRIQKRSELGFTVDGSLTGSDFVAHLLDDAGGRTDEADPAVNASLGKVRALR